MSFKDGRDRKYKHTYIRLEVFANEIMQERETKSHKEKKGRNKTIPIVDDIIVQVGDIKKST